MNMCLFYQHESGFPKLSTVTRIDLHFRTTSASLQLPSLQSTFGSLSHPSAHSPFASEYPGHVSTEYPKTLSRVHASRIISPSNVRHRLYTCCNTSVESSQTYQHISHNISESFYCTKIRTGTHSGIHPLRHLYSHCLKFSLDFGSIVKHTTSSPPFFEFIGTYLFLIDFFYLSVLFLSPFAFLSISFYFFCVSCFGPLSFHSYLSYYSFRIFSNICTLMYL
jgi:hypothetical protein